MGVCVCSAVDEEGSMVAELNTRLGLRSNTGDSFPDSLSTIRSADTTGGSSPLFSSSSGSDECDTIRQSGQRKLFLISHSPYI